MPLLHAPCRSVRVGRDLVGAAAVTSWGSVGRRVSDVVWRRPRMGVPRIPHIQRAWRPQFPGSISLGTLDVPWRFNARDIDVPSGTVAVDNAHRDRCATCGSRRGRRPNWNGPNYTAIFAGARWCPLLDGSPVSSPSGSCIPNVRRCTVSWWGLANADVRGHRRRLHIPVRRPPYRNGSGPGGGGRRLPSLIAAVTSTRTKRSPSIAVIFRCFRRNAAGA